MGSVSEGIGKMLHTCVGSVSKSTGKMYTCVGSVSEGTERCCTPAWVLCQFDDEGGRTMGSVSEGTGKMLHTCVGSVSEGTGKMLHTCVSFASVWD